MRTYLLLLAIVLPMTFMSAQIFEVEHPIMGLGEFRFGMSLIETREAMDIHASDNSTAMVISEQFLMATKLTMVGYVFDNCIFNFDDNGLSTIMFTLKCKKNDKDPKEFYELLDILEKDYGKQPEGSGIPFLWRNKQQGLLSLHKSYDKKTKAYSITISSTKFISSI